MENSKLLALDAKKAMIGGVIAVILSPISIILAYYLGQQLEKPRLTITNIEQQFATVSPQGSDMITLPDSILNRLKGNAELMMLADVDASDFENPLSKEDAEDLVSELKNASSKYDMNARILSENINKISAWDGKSELVLEAINPQFLGGKSLNALVKEDRNGALTILRGLHLNMENRKGEIKGFVDFVSPFINDKSEKARTGEATFVLGILNAGKTDAVIFPKAELHYNRKIIYFKAASPRNQAIYSVIAPHSFKQILYTLNMEEGNAKDIAEWKAMVKNHANTNFDFKIKSIEKEMSYSTNLEAK